MEKQNDSLKELSRSIESLFTDKDQNNSEAYNYKAKYKYDNFRRYTSEAINKTWEKRGVEKICLISSSFRARSQKI